MQSLIESRRYLIPFRGSLLPQIFTDVLVIGGGVAGLRAALSAQSLGADVIVLAKSGLTQSNTNWAQGGIAGVMDEKDTFSSHIEDTLVAGAGACDEDAVRLVVERGPRLLEELMGWGMKADRNGAGILALGREGGHSAARILHANGDATGAEVQRVLIARAREVAGKRGGIRLFENCFSLDLLSGKDGTGAVQGAITYHTKYGLQMIWAKSVILAAGGVGQLFRETTNPSVATGDGLAMAYRAGATLADMAYMQFHPTTLYLAGASRSLITEAIRGEGAHLLDAHGRRFMLDIHPMAELAPRDIVARSIVRQIAKQAAAGIPGGIMLDCRHIEGFEEKFPSITELLRKFDLDAKQDLIPIHPAAHYMVGGVLTDLQGRSTVPGLFAAGEVACTGLHGANRLASNSLLEGLVFGEITGREAARESSARAAIAPTNIISDVRPSERAELDLADVRSSLRSAMWKQCGIERTGPQLDGLVDMIDFWARYTLDKVFDEPAGWETQNLLTVGSVFAQAALWREESRGCHTRTDYPEARDTFAVRDCFTRGHEMRTRGLRGSAEHREEVRA